MLPWFSISAFNLEFSGRERAPRTTAFNIKPVILYFKRPGLEMWANLQALSYATNCSLRSILLTRQKIPVVLGNGIRSITGT